MNKTSDVTTQEMESVLAGFPEAEPFKLEVSFNSQAVLPCIQVDLVGNDKQCPEIKKFAHVLSQVNELTHVSVSINYHEHPRITIYPTGQDIESYMKAVEKSLPLPNLNASPQ